MVYFVLVAIGYFVQYSLDIISFKNVEHSQLYMISNLVNSKMWYTEYYSAGFDFKRLDAFLGLVT